MPPTLFATRWLLQLWTSEPASHDFASSQRTAPITAVDTSPFLHPFETCKILREKGGRNDETERKTRKREKKNKKKILNKLCQSLQLTFAHLPSLPMINYHKFLIRLPDLSTYDNPKKNNQSHSHLHSWSAENENTLLILPNTHRP